MVNFKICLRYPNKSGFWPVYIRVINNRSVGYIKTCWMVDKNGIGRKNEIKDPYVLERCSKIITGYIKRLNGVDTSSWTFNRLRSYLSDGQGEVSFSAFARGFINKLEKLGHEGNAHLYKSSLASLERFIGSGAIRFSDIGKEKLEDWIASLGSTLRARTLYPRCIRVIFHEAMATSADPVSQLPRIAYNPWGNISIPESEPAPKRAIDVEKCRLFFTADIPPGKRYFLATLGRDVALLSFCLAGINSVDLFNLTRDELNDGIISYRRTKTRNRRRDGAYFEMQVNEMATEIIDRFRASDGDGHLLRFAEMYRNARSFNAMVNRGIKDVCRILNIPDDKAYSLYSFRHTWATIAQNECGASLSEIGFAMNHIQHDAVTRGYIKIDFTPAWNLNQRVWNVVFGNSTTNQMTNAEVTDPLVSPRSMVYARAYFRGEVLAEVSDIGFGNVETVISKLATMLPDAIPTGCAVQFRIKNVDVDREAVYERIKAKGF